jgi:polyisoprenoid-binding protein YceI
LLAGTGHLQGALRPEIYEGSEEGKMAWKVDRDRSKVEFVVKHLVVTQVRGRFESFEGTLEMDEERPEASSVEGSVDAASVKTGISPRDGNLRSAGRFDVARFPQMGFRSTRIEDLGGERFKVYGDLTIKEVTRPVVFEVTSRGEQPAEGGKRRWAFGATITLNRKEFGVQWHPLIEVGSLAVGEEVRGEMEVWVVEEG